MTVLAVAHRAGNDLATLAAARSARVDVVEADVHLRRGRLEVRHAKSLGPLPRLWERWELLPDPAEPMLLEHLLRATGDQLLLLDLKGVGGVGSAVARVLGQAPRPVLVCARWWPGLRPLAAIDGVRVVLSVRGRVELAGLHRRLRRGEAPYGVSVHRSLLSAALVGRLHEQVAFVTTWPVEDLPALAEVLATGVSAVTSSDPQVLGALTSRR